jgi:NAD(P)-dependent dehydrogenase (short-subunit alcohol dehydrogenase family)
MGRVSGKVAVVSGAASGLGAAFARVLAREGAVVVLADLDVRGAEQGLADIRAAGGDGIALHLDAADEASWQDVIAAIRARYGRLNIAVNNAGTNTGYSFPTDTTLEDWRKVMAVNLDGVFLGTKHAMALMRDSDPVNGSIINISSVMGIVGKAGIGAYNASKGGVRLFTKSVALSCAEARLNIRCNSIHPGFIDTPLLRTAMARFNDPAKAQAVYDALQPVGHLGEPDDIAHGVLYLASDEAKFVTGSELVIDGGYTAC